MANNAVSGCHGQLLRGTLSPAAVPPAFRGWPEPSDFVFALNTPAATAKLRDAADTFGRLAQSSDNSVEERRLFEVWNLACLAVDPRRRTEASSYARHATSADPGQHRLVSWILAQRYEEVDLAPIERALAAAHASGTATALEIIALVMLQIAASRTDDALSVLDAARRLFDANNASAWHHFRAVALLTAGRVTEAAIEIQAFDGAERADPLWSEIQRLESQKSGDWDAFSARLEERYLTTKTPDALLEYCEFEAHRKHWAAVARYAAELVARVGNGYALRLAAVATFNAGEAGDCLRLLALREDLFADPTSAEELERLAIAANRSTGNLLEARRRAERFAASSPSVENLMLMAQLQLETGDPKALALNARNLLRRGDLTPEQALRLGVLVRHEDPSSAQSLWRQSVSKGLPDEAVGAALSLGYHLGLDRELGPLLARMNELSTRGTGGFERKTLSDLIEFAKRHHENVSWFALLYDQGKTAIHMIPTGTRGQMADLFHASLDHMENNPSASSAGLLARHGGRAAAGFPEKVPDWRLHLDITSLLLAAHLDVLPKMGFLSQKCNWS